MTSTEIRNNVQAAIQKSWPEFELNHPNLARVLDESLLIDAAIESLSDDEAYQETMADATAMGNAASVIGDYVSRFVNKWLRTLI